MSALENGLVVQFSGTLTSNPITKVLKNVLPETITKINLL